MNVLHISTLARGGAFTGMYRLHSALINAGVDSNVLVRDEIKNKYNFRVSRYNESFRRESIKNRIFSKMGYNTTAFQMRKSYLKEVRNIENNFFSFPFSNIDITQSSAYKEADIINLHWVGDYLDYATFFKNNTKPVVWTLRDVYPLQGIFHMERDKKNNTEDWRRLDDRIIDYKAKKLKKSRSSINIVGISDYMTQKAQESLLLSNYPYQTIYNCINQSYFENLSKKKARELLNINEDITVLSVVANSLHNPRKGFKELKSAICNMGKCDIEIISCGTSCEVFPYWVRYRNMGKLPLDILKILYTASDAFVFPTKEEPLGNVMLEAMACGTPVIGTPVGGPKEIIKDGFNGILTTGTAAKDIEMAIRHFISLKDTFDSEAIKQFVRDNFSPAKIADQYIQLYQSLIG